MPQPHSITPTLLAGLGLVTLTPLALAAEGDVPASQDTPPAVTEPTDTAGTEDTWIEIVTPQTSPTEGEAEAVQVVIEPAVESSDRVDPAPIIVTPADTDASLVEPAEPADESRVISMDRSDWPTMIVSPIDGKVTHHPHFTGEAPLGDDIVTPLHAPDPVWQLQEALAGAHANNLNGENLSHLGAQPVVGLTQFVLMPARMILENPWSKRTSPSDD